MADVFISYRNTPERRAFVRRLAAILRAHEVSVWWDYGLEAGESYRTQITEELAKARIVAPLWCSESISSKWVAMEAELGKDKLLPARLQKVVPPDAFEAIQAADLIGWDGSVSHPRLGAFVQRVCIRLGKPTTAPTDMIETLADLPALAPLPDAAIPVANTTAIPAHDFAFWKGEWEAHGSGNDLVALRAIAEHSPPYFADRAKARVVEVERAIEEESWRREGRIQVHIGAGANEMIIRLKPGAGEVFRDIAIGPEMVVVPAGRFLMGDASSQNVVNVEAPFAIGRFTLTFAEWDAAQAHPGWDMHSGITARRLNDRDWGREKQPAIGVSWEDATAYCGWLSRVTAKTYRLPTEAEWEYCCRAGSTTAFWWGDEISTQHANYNGNEVFGNGKKGPNRERTIAVDSFRPNPWGLYQVHGNVWEWCEDNYDETSFVLRGGSWLGYPASLRSAVRYKARSGYRNFDIGFRIARTL